MNSATNAPKPTKPKAALGINGNKALRAATNNPNPPAATTHFNNASESNWPTASNIAIKASPISFTPSSIICGTYLANPLITTNIKSPNPSISGPA